MADFTYKIEKNVFSIPADTDGWNLELNLISWGGREAKWDLRKWQADHEKMGKGCSMSEDEVVILFQNSKAILEAITGEVVSENTEEPKTGKDDLPFE